jgi:hypothetical protein
MLAVACLVHETYLVCVVVVGVCRQCICHCPVMCCNGQLCTPLAYTHAARTRAGSTQVIIVFSQILAGHLGTAALAVAAVGNLLWLVGYYTIIGCTTGACDTHIPTPEGCVYWSCRLHMAVGVINDA